jgi:hypothetical protein
MVEAKIRGMSRHPKVLAALDRRGIQSVDDLTPGQQLRMLIRFHLFQDLQLYERQQAEIAAGRAAEVDVDQNFDLEND